MPANEVGYFGLTEFRGYSPQEARQVTRQNLIDDPETVEMLKQLFAEHPDYKEDAYKDWATKGLLPPFDGLV